MGDDLFGGVSPRLSGSDMGRYGRSRERRIDYELIDLNLRYPYERFQDVFDRGARNFQEAAESFVKLHRRDSLSGMECAAVIAHGASKSRHHNFSNIKYALETLAQSVKDLPNLPDDSSAYMEQFKAVLGYAESMANFKTAERDRYEDTFSLWFGSRSDRVPLKQQQQQKLDNLLEFARDICDELEDGSLDTAKKIAGELISGRSAFHPGSHVNNDGLLIGLIHSAMPLLREGPATLSVSDIGRRVIGHFVTRDYKSQRERILGPMLSNELKESFSRVSQDMLFAEEAIEPIRSAIWKAGNERLNAVLAKPIGSGEKLLTVDALNDILSANAR